MSEIMLLPFVAYSKFRDKNLSALHCICLESLLSYDHVVLGCKFWFEIGGTNC